MLKNATCKDFEEHAELCLDSLPCIDSSLQKGSSASSDIACVTLLVALRGQDGPLSARDDDEITDMLLGAMQVLANAQ